MTDAGNGQYSYTFTLSGSGNVSISVTVLSPGAIYAEYWTNTAYSGTAGYTRYETTIYNDWGSGTVTPTPNADYIAAQYSGKFVPPTTGTYYMACLHDDGFYVNMGGCTYQDTGCCSWRYWTCSFTAGVEYDFYLSWQEGGGEAYIILLWQAPGSGSYVALDSSYLYSEQRVGDTPHTVNLEVTTVPNSSTVESKPSSVIAGESYSMTMQSRNAAGTAYSVNDDTYYITWTCTQSARCGSTSYTGYGSHYSSGLYTASFTPTKAGTYTINVYMTNDYTAAVSSVSTTVSGQGYTVTVYPGEIDPAKCYTNLSGSPLTQASIAYNFYIYFVDLWDNLHYLTLTDDISNGMVVTVVADYVNHDNYPSNLDVPDYPDQVADYGTSVSGSASDNNDGTMTGTVTVYWAGTHTLTVQVDYVNVIGSTFSYLEVEPYTIYGDNCISPDAMTQMYAGWDYFFRIQARDQWFNNIQKTLSSACGLNYSAGISILSGSGSYTGSLSDDSAGVGVYRVDYAIPTSQSLGYYANQIYFLGNLVTLVPVVNVEACTNERALDDGKINTAPGSTINRSISYMVEDSTQTASIPLVTYYCNQTPTQVLTNSVASYEGAPNVDISTSTLSSTYGIIINYSTTSPTVTVYSTSTTAPSYSTFELRFDATLSEDTDWTDFIIVTIDFTNPSFPSQSSLSDFVPDQAYTAASAFYTFKIQSRNRSGNDHVTADDTYTATMTRTDGGGSEVYTATSAHESSGLYAVSLDPVIAGTYSLSVHLTNYYTTQSGTATEIANSPWTVTINPGAVSGPLCYTDIPESPTNEASTSYDFTISFRDALYNLHTSSMSDEISDGMAVTVVADYVNHDNYPSPIEIADLTSWQSTYGTSISGSASDNNDGTMAGTVNVYRAGTYTLTVQVDSDDVIGSPTEYLEIEPTTLYAPNCVTKDLPTEMYAGYDYSFLIQGRDQYHNNLIKKLSQAAGVNYSVSPYLTSNSGYNFSGTMTDYSSFGAFTVSMSLSKTQTAGTYNYNVLMLGQTVPTATVTVKACINTIAESLGLVESAGTTETLSTIQYTIEGSTQTADLIQVPIYCEHTVTQTIFSATVTDEGGTTTSLNESGLNTYGITLVQSTTDPKISVYTSDVSLSDLVFEITISSTVTEETTWADYSVITIDYSNPSIPSGSTIESSAATHEAGTVYTMTMQSRTAGGTALTWNDDTYMATLTRTDGGGSEEYTGTAVHTSNGLYTVQLTPLIAGTYSMSVHLTNDYTESSGVATEISGSPFTVTVDPGEIDPAACYTSLTGSPLTQAASAYGFTISFVDLWGNLHYQTLSDEISDGMAVTVVADYVNHDNYPSPIGVADLTSWQSTYGTSISGSASDSNDGTMAGTVTVYRAGTYTLTVQVDGVDVIGSPFSSLEIEPTTISAPSCVAQSPDTQMYAGYDYSFIVQARDQYSNNIAKTISQAIGVNYSMSPYLRSNSGYNFSTVTLSDDTDAGIYLVELSVPLTQQSGIYAYNLILSGSLVVITDVQIDPCINTVAQALGFIGADGTTTDEGNHYYAIGDVQQEIDLPLVEFYCTHTPVQLVTTATLTDHNGNTSSLSEGQLATYGITIVQSATDPKLLIYSTNTSWITSSFDLRISATVSEETTWANDAIMVIDYSNPTVPSVSDISSQSSSTHPAGTDFLMSIQSRDAPGNMIDHDDDNYSIVFTDGGSNTLSTTGTYTSNGLYEMQVTPTIAGTYTLTIDCTNDYTTRTGAATAISGSPFTINVVAGEIDPAACYTDLTGEPTTTANVAYDFTINFVDLWGNVHQDTLTDEVTDGMVVSVVADYVNHYNWVSPISVPDEDDWKTTYGTSISGTTTDNNDGTMTGSLTLQRAATYALTVTVDSVDVTTSPFLSLEVEPGAIDGSLSVADGVPEIMYAGYDFDFQIQGRDSWGNNIKILLEDAVGADLSVIISDLNGARMRNLQDVMTPTISDHQSPGVYQVDVFVPMTTTASTYAFTIMLGGQQVVTPLINLQSCVNEYAAYVGILPYAGKIFQLDTVNYVLGEDQQSADLHKVEILCTHEPFQSIYSATVDFASGVSKDLTEAELADYGIWIQQDEESPTLQVYSKDFNIGEAVFVVRVGSSVVEEPDWEDYSLITINYAFEYTANIKVVLADGAPRFDPDSVSKYTLEVSQDSNGSQVLTPISLECYKDSDWEGVLPDILDEDPEEVQVSVTVGQAAAFLNYDPIKRTFSLKRQDRSLDIAEYQVFVQLTDPAGNLVSYTLRVTFECQIKIFEPERPEFYQEVTYEEQVFDENPPVPFIHSISADGLVRIRFNTTMQEVASLVDKESENAPERRRRQLTSAANDDDDIENISGSSNPTYTNFTRIHNSTVTIDGLELPSFDVSIEPAEPDNTSKCSRQLEFKWEVIEFTPDEMTLRLDFSWPECVSTSTSEGDFLVIKFNDQRLFKDVNDKLMWPQFTVKARIKRQEAISVEEQNTMNYLDIFCMIFIAVSTVFTIITAILTKRGAGMQRLSTAFKNVQIAVFSLLIKVQLAAHTEEFLNSLQKQLTFRYFETEQMAKAGFGTELTPPVDVHFEQMGFTTSDTICNISSIVCLLVILATITNLAVLFKNYGPRGNPVRDYLSGIDEGVVSKGAHIFIDWSFLFLTICCVISLYQRNQGVYVYEPSQYIALAFILLAPSYLVGYYSHRVWQLNGMPIEGETEEELAICKLRREKEMATTALEMFSFVRRIALAAVVTFGRTSILAQLLFIQICSIMVIAYVGYMRPHLAKGDRRMELWNEFTILLLYGQILAQADLFDLPETRIVAGWSLIGVLVLSVVTNFGYVVITETCELVRWTKLMMNQVQAQPVDAKQLKNQQQKIHSTSNVPLPNKQNSEQKNNMHSIAEISEEDSSDDSDGEQEDSKRVRPSNKIDEDNLVMPTGSVYRVSQRRHDRIEVKTRAMPSVRRNIQGNRNGPQEDDTIQKSARQGLAAQGIEDLIADIEGALSMSDEVSDVPDDDSGPIPSGPVSESSTMMGTRNRFGVGYDQTVVQTDSRLQSKDGVKQRILANSTNSFMRAQTNLDVAADDEFEKKIAEQEVEHERRRQQEEAEEEFELV